MPPDPEDLDPEYNPEPEDAGSEGHDVPEDLLELHEAIEARDAGLLPVDAGAAEDAEEVDE